LADRALAGKSKKVSYHVSVCNGSPPLLYCGNSMVSLGVWDGGAFAHQH
jgi:hypothetical protein